ncbi:UBX domain-containing protein 7 [Datura stramonium]|uniref:UBX domain-containing protein 7 n=1 Tax=Datura stramonium TaxID=4076 RepID=A0ABS8SKI5_DATST|nr:UBX domain-containing protein 7 [Datura stramonium]
MTYVLSNAQQRLVSSFLEIAVGQTAGTARQFLQSTSWNLEEAIQLFYSGNNDGTAFNSPPLTENDAALWEHDDDVRPPLPVRREALYGDNSGLYNGSSRNSEQIWSSTFPTKHNSLASLYRPPYELMYNGPFEKAKDAAAARNKWLLVNLQSKEEFSSDLLNRDTWANEIVAQTIKSNFVFWQVDDDKEGKKVCAYYKLDSLPVILVIDPITGQNMRSWNGMVEPENLLEDAMAFMDRSPSEYHADLVHKQHGETRREGDKLQEINKITDDGEDQNQLLMKKIFYLPLPEEPKCDRNLLCRIAIRLADGRRIQRNFLKTDSIKLLWSFCSTQLEEGQSRPFRFTRAIPGASKFWEYDNNLTFEESGLANSIVSVITT